MHFKFELKIIFARIIVFSPIFKKLIHSQYENSNH